MRTERFFSKLDQYCDYTPLSPINNAVDIVFKFAVIPFLKNETVENTHYFKHVKEKNLGRCFALIFLPVIGGAFVAAVDRKNVKFAKSDLENGTPLAYMSFKHKDSKEIALHAIEKNVSNYQYVSKWLKDDLDVFELAQLKDPTIVRRTA